MKNYVLALASVIIAANESSAQTMTMDAPVVAAGQISVQGTINLPMGWAINNTQVIVYAIPPSGGITQQSAKGTATNTTWNNGANPAGPIVIQNLKTGAYSVYAIVIVSDNKGNLPFLTTPIVNVNVP